MHDIEAHFLQGFTQNTGEAMNAVGDALQTFRAVVDGVEHAHQCQQYLRSTDVGVGLFAADVLLAGLHGHTQCRLAFGIDGDTDNTTRRRALVLVTEGEESGVRATEAQRYTKALISTHHYVGPHGGGALHQYQAHDIGGNGDQCVFAVGDFNQVSQVADFTAGAGVLQQRTKVVGITHYFFGLTYQHFKAEVFGAGLNYRQSLRVSGFVHKEVVGFVFAHLALAHGHGFGRGGAFIQHGGVGQFHTCQVDNHLLEVQQAFQTALGDLGLVRGVGGVPTGVFHHIAQYHVGHDGVVVAHADVGLEHLILAGDGFDFSQRLIFADSNVQVQIVALANARRYGFLNQLIDRSYVQFRQHGVGLLGVGPNMATDKSVVVFQFKQGSVAGIARHERTSEIRKMKRPFGPKIKAAYYQFGQ